MRRTVRSQARLLRSALDAKPHPFTLRTAEFADAHALDRCDVELVSECLHLTGMIELSARDSNGERPYCVWQQIFSAGGEVRVRITGQGEYFLPRVAEMSVQT